jgi:outer membrane protein assembly factor BamB
MRKPLTAIGRISLLIVALGGVSTAQAADWPTWGGNASRNGAVADPLPETLHLTWKLQQREPDPAWHSNQDRVQFDRMYEPIVAGKRLFVGSMVNDRMTAYDTETGKELWRFYTDGPVRLAPAVWNDNVYFACDDGNLYCIRATDGSLVWKFQGAPLDRKVLGNDRLVSIYPARGAPVVYDGTVYFAASVWPFMGVFIHALDAETGKVVWTNSGTGSMYILQQHDRPAFAGIAPQGYLVATEEILLVSGGQTVPAAFDRHTGKFVHFNLNSREMGEKGGSGYHVRTAKDFFVTNEHMFRMSDGAYLARINYPLITDKSLINVDSSGSIHAYDHEMKIEKTKDRKGRATVKASLNERWKADVEPKLNRLHLMAGSRVFGTGDDGLIAAVEISEATGDPKVTWTGNVEGDPLSLIAADGKLFVSTDKGTIYCFAETPPATGSPVVIEQTGEKTTSPGAVPDHWKETAKQFVSESGADSGFCLLLGIGSGRLLDELLAESKLNIIAIDPDAEKVRLHRQRLDDAGVYGSRAAVLTGDILSLQLPPYLTRLVVSEDLEAAGIGHGEEFVKRIFEAIRPYGGTACLTLSMNSTPNSNVLPQRTKTRTRSSNDRRIDLARRCLAWGLCQAPPLGRTTTRMQGTPWDRAKLW